MHVISSLSHGGAEKLAIELASLQKREGLDVSIAYLNSAEWLGNNEEIEKNFQTLLDNLGINTYPLDVLPSRSYWLTRTKNFKRSIKRENPHVLHVHLGRGLMLMLLGRVRIPAVMTIHSINVGFPKLLFRLFRILHVRYVAVATKIAQLFQSSVQGEIIVIPNGVDLEKFENVNLVRNSEKFNFVAIGRVLPPKNYPMLLDAVEDVLTHTLNRKILWQLKIAGDGPLLNEMKELVTAKSLGEVVEFIGGCDNIPAFLAQADAFVMSSDYEGMPMAMLEAMSAKLPVVCTNFLGVDDVVESEVSALISPVGDATALAKNMIRVIESNTLRDSLVSNGSKNLERFSIKVTHQEYLKIYDLALSDGLN